MHQGPLTGTRSKFYSDMSNQKYFWTGMPAGWYLTRNGPAGAYEDMRIYAWHPNSKAKSPPTVGWVSPAGSTVDARAEQRANANAAKDQLIGNVTGNVTGNVEGIEAVRKMVNTAASGGVAAFSPDCHLKIRKYCEDPSGALVGVGPVSVTGVGTGKKNQIWVSVSGFREDGLFDGKYAIHDIESPADWGRGTANLYERDGYTRVVSKI